MSSFLQTEERYIQFDPFAGDMDVDAKCKTVKVVTVRKERPCYMGQSPDSTPHMIKKGDRARFEKCLIDGQWHISYICFSCIDADFKELGYVD